ncbi:MAG: PKD domain-containing protein [Bacteroidota bacterium]
MKKSYVFLSIITFFLFAFNTTQAQAPVANFKANNTKGCGFTVISFTDLSTNTPTSWLWNFGDGSATSIQKNPTHAYLTPGIFNVTLTATNGSGTNTITKNSFIVIYALPSANFSANILNGCTPANILFTNQTTIGSAPISSQQWDFGDGSSAITYNASHIYNTPGVFQVSLLVSDTNGCTNKAVKNNYITINQSPSASFTATPTASCAPPQLTNFTNTSTGTGLTYQWQFGDGNTSTALNPSNNYVISGNFNPSLIVLSSNGCSDTSTLNIPIQVGTYGSKFTATPTNGCRPLAVQFTDTTIGATSWKWIFGDGTTSNVQNPSHVYNNSGFYTVTLITSNSIGCIDTLVKNNYINVSTGVAVNFTADNTEDCVVPFTVNFTDNSVGAASWLWNFGDGTTSNSQNPSHTYTNLGNYNVTLIASNANGCSDTLVKANYIKILKPTANYTATPTQGCHPLQVNFTNTSTSANPIVDYRWDFGDGTTFNGLFPDPMHVPMDTGSYTVTLVIVDSKGCTDTVVKPNYINVGMPPVIDFSSIPLSGCHPLSTQFTDASSPYTNTWQWNFGDNGTSNLQNPSHIYADTGYFDVTLIAGHNGCFDTLVKTDYIQVLPPKPMFSATPQTSCLAPLLTQFNDESIEPETWFWDFGDGNTSTIQNPTNNYLNPGQYTVKLVVTNSNGCKDSLTNINYIRISHFDTGFSQDTTQICQTNGVTYTDTTISAIPITNRMWDFGDGTIVNTAAATVSHIYVNPGQYTVKLVVTDQINCKDSVTKTNFITVYTLPSPRFTADVTTGCVPLTVTFDSQLSSAIAPATITNWLWNFGDGQTSTQANPSHTYLTRGNYNVTLTVTTSQGCDSTLIKTNYINPTFPYPSFTSNAITCYNDSLLFTNTSTGTSLTYLWNFGDGNSSTSTNPYHKYIVDTTTVFTVSLTATDINGCDSTITKNITISRPVPLFTANNPSAFCPPLFISFNNESSTDVTNWSWNFGDPTSGGSNTSTQTNPQHVFANPGKYTISLIASNSDGCIDTLIIPDYISVDGPSGTFSFTPLNGCSPLTVKFTANALKTDSYTWVFGDGSSITTTQDTVTYQYITGGNYTPVLVLNNFTTSPGDTCSISVISPQNLIVNSGIVEFGAVDTFACNPSSFLFFEYSTAYPSIDSCTWNFGDGSSQTLIYPATYPLSHTYTNDGMYDVSLEIFVSGCSFLLNKADFINIFTPPALKFSLSDTASCPPLIIDFNVIDSTYSDSVSAWSWNFDDGTALVTDKNPSHTYNASGNYDIALTVDFQNGCSEIYTQPTNLTVYPLPIADFITDTNFVYAGDFITFIDNSTGQIAAWNWTFSNGNTSNQQNPSYTWQYFGTYETTLIVTTDHGCLDTITKEIEIIERIEIPNAFTPDGDGINDVFMKGHDLIIVNRWGQTLYEGIEGWDGTYNGEQAVPGTYYYILVVNDVKDHPKKYQGSLTLIRK